MPVLTSITMLPGSISLLTSSGASAFSVAAGKQPGLANADLTLDLGWPDVGQAVRPTLDVAVVAADVDDLHVLGDARQRLGRGARGQRREQQVELRQGTGSHFSITSSASLAGTPGKRSTNRLPALPSPRRRLARKTGGSRPGASPRRLQNR